MCSSLIRLAAALLAALVASAAAAERAPRRASGSPSAAAPSRASPHAAACPSGPAAEDAIIRVDAAGEIQLALGRRVLLADLRLPDPADPRRPDSAADVPARPDARAWLGSLVGRAVLVQETGPRDRWDRVPAVVALREGGGIDLAELLVAEGLGLVDAGERDGLCRPALLAAEAGARAARRGFWASDRALLPADRPEMLREAGGRFTLVEGRVVSVGERRDRTYLNFGRDFARDFAVVVPKRIWARLKQAGASATALTGKTIRVRGLLEIRRAPVLEIEAADMLEWQAPAPARDP